VTPLRRVHSASGPSGSALIHAMTGSLCLLT
jgi:hypothetical protein